VLLAWVAFPLALALLALGCGLLAERASGLRLPGALVLPLGLALLIVEADLVTMTGATAQLAAPLAVAFAAAGFGLTDRRPARPGAWPIACAVGVFAVYAAPIVLSGQATFAGYITLDDTSTWLALTDRVMEHGRTLSGLAPSTYRQVLDDYLSTGYPLGGFMPLGLGGKLTGQDVAWLFQPTMAFSAAMLALAIFAATERLLSSGPLRALVAFLGAQAALLYAYSLWSGIKELAAAAAIALVCASVTVTIERWDRLRATLPTALSVAALLAILSPAGAVWVLVPAAVALVVVVPLGLRRSARIAAALVGAIALLSIPSIATARSFIGGASGGDITSSNDVANLGHPLDGLQLFGIWPASDFRDRPHDAAAAYVLIAVLVGAAVVALGAARRRRAWGLPLYAATAVGGYLLVRALQHVGLSSPWLSAKAMAEASPALVGAGAAGAAALFESGRRVEGAVVGAAIAAGVLWSNGLTYSGAWLAPRPQLAELQTIGARFAGEGPTLMTDTEPYGARHFLRSIDPENASDRRTRLVPLVDGQGVAKGTYADLDQFQLDGILVYRTLVLARSPSESRPPSIYSLVWSGRYYDVWQRPDDSPPILAHVPLGDPLQPGGVAPCAEVRRLAALAGPTGRLAAPPRTPAVVVGFAGVPLPAGWVSDPEGHVFPRRGAGAIATGFTLPRAGRYGLWLGGSFRGRLRLYVDGRLVADARDRLVVSGYAPLGSAVLAAGDHRLVLRYGGADLHPGSGGFQFGLGPLVLTRGPEDVPVVYVPSASATTLCGRTLDWIEALGG
jgi:hypothetical protein